VNALFALRWIFVAALIGVVAWLLWKARRDDTP
jgi:tryptophan-rich sensory protein